jgi:hypothetical protein
LIQVQAGMASDWLIDFWGRRELAKSLRKSSGLDVVDRINVILSANEAFASRLESFIPYVADEVLAHDILFGETAENETDIEGQIIYISISRI